MAIEPTRVVIFPRFSSLVGATTFRTAPMNVRAYYHATFRGWRGDGIGVTSLDIAVEQSDDLRYWFAPEDWTLDADEEDSYAPPTLDQEWLRLAVTIEGTSPSVPLWILGEFLPRGQ